MKAHKSKYFTEVLQISIFLKYHAKNCDGQISEGIRLMTIDQLYLNIIHQDYQTTLTKQILTFLISVLPCWYFCNQRFGAAIYYLLKGPFNDDRKAIINCYYTQIAIQHYCYLTQTSLPNANQYMNIFQFCKLEEQLKFKILAELVSHIWSKSSSNKKNQNEDHLKQTKKSEQNEQPRKNCLNKIQQMLILGEDNNQMYLYTLLMPEYILTLSKGKWGILDRNKINSRMQKLLEGKKSANILHLMQNIHYIHSKLMPQKLQSVLPVRFHRVKQNIVDLIKQRVDFMKKKMLQINERYCHYLKLYRNRRWADINRRQKYMNMLQSSKTLKQITQTFIYFYQSSKNVYTFLKQDSQQESIPEDKLKEFYQIVSYNVQHCNINFKKIAIQKNYICSQDLSNQITNKKRIDLYVLVEVNVLVQQQVISKLEEKQQLYFRNEKKRMEKMCEKKQVKEEHLPNGRVLRKKQYRMSSQSNSSIIDSKNLRQLRPRKSKKTKKFGVTTLDSDQSQSQEQFSKGSTKQNIDLSHYQLATRSKTRQ